MYEVMPKKKVGDYRSEIIDGNISGKIIGIEQNYIGRCLGAIDKRSVMGTYLHIRNCVGDEKVEFPQIFNDMEKKYLMDQDVDYTMKYQTDLINGFGFIQRKYYTLHINTGELKGQTLEGILKPY